MDSIWSQPDVSTWPYVPVAVFSLRISHLNLRPAAHFLKFHKLSLWALVWFKATTDAAPPVNSNLDLSSAESAVPLVCNCGAAGRWSFGSQPMNSPPSVWERVQCSTIHKQQPAWPPSIHPSALRFYASGCGASRLTLPPRGCEAMQYDLNVTFLEC